MSFRTNSGVAEFDSRTRTQAETAATSARKACTSVVAEAKDRPAGTSSIDRLAGSLGRTGAAEPSRHR
eukprot:13054437-Heterocapsa_arctica.AAC.1